MAIFKVQYKGIDGGIYEKPVVVKPGDVNIIAKFLDKVYDVDHPILYIQNFSIMPREEQSDKS